MSNITENTIVIKSSDRSIFEEQIDKSEALYPMCIYQDKDICIFTFDYNGDNPWYQGVLEIDYLMNEINYLDGEEPLTEIFIDGMLTEVNYHTIAALKALFPEKDFYPIVQKIAYSC